MNKYQFVYFDLDDTLLDHTHAEKCALQTLFQEQTDLFGSNDFPDVYAAYRKINPVVWQKYSAGEFTKIQAKVGRFEQLLAAMGRADYEASLWRADAYLNRYSYHWQEVEGAIDAFKNTAAQVPVGIMTNGFSEIQRAKLSQFPIFDELSKDVIVSEEVGFLKPDVRLFKHAEAAAKVPGESILYVGDSLSSDVKGGLGAGWKVAWYSKENYDHDDVWSFTDWSTFVDKLS